MKIFLGWSGETSKKVALALHGWLPKVIQSVKPYISSEDIAKGARWASEIAKELQTSNYGIICVTRENVQSAWINFESGALSREIEKSFVTPFLFDLRQGEVQGPLGLFQSVINEKDDIFRLLESINSKQDDGQKLELSTLKEVFEMWWPKLEAELAKIATDHTHKGKPAKRDTHEMIEELLTRARTQQRQTDARLSEFTDALARLFADQSSQLKSLIGLMTALTVRVERVEGMEEFFARKQKSSIEAGQSPSAKTFNAFYESLGPFQSAGGEPTFVTVDGEKQPDTPVDRRKE